MSEKQFIRTLESEALKIFKKHEIEIVDIILFGSIRKGKEKPRDIDILIIFKKKMNHALAQELRQRIEQRVEYIVDITLKTYEMLFGKEFTAREGILGSGYSLVYKKPIANGLGYKSYVFFIYKLVTKTKSERMRFYYSLYGRKSQGILEKYHAKKYTDTVILCPIETSENVKEFLEYWNIEYTDVPVLIPERLG